MRLGGMLVNGGSSLRKQPVKEGAQMIALMNFPTI